jgi:hypothetical protein
METLILRESKRIFYKERSRDFFSSSRVSTSSFREEKATVAACLSRGRRRGCTVCITCCLAALALDPTHTQIIIIIYTRAV